MFSTIFPSSGTEPGQSDPPLLTPPLPSDPIPLVCHRGLHTFRPSGHPFAPTRWRARCVLRLAVLLWCTFSIYLCLIVHEELFLAVLPHSRSCYMYIKPISCLFRRIGFLMGLGGPLWSVFRRQANHSRGPKPAFGRENISAPAGQAI